MKKLFLLLAGTAFVMSANAQERHSSIVFNGGMQQNQSVAAKSPINANIPGHTQTTGAAMKTTSTGGSRWYNYGSYLSNLYGSTGVGLAAPYIWNDTTTKGAYSDGAGGTVYDFVDFTSVGLSFDPYFPAWNDAGTYAGAIGFTGTEAYTIDSVSFEGIYMRSYASPAKILVTDTIRLALVYGDGTGTSDFPTYYFTGMTANYSIDTLRFISMIHDSLHNRAGTATVHTYDVLLHSTDTAGDYFKAIPTSFSVPAGNFAGMSLTFISGDHTIPFGDTVYTGSTTGTGYKSGMFRPFVEFVGGSTPSFPTYAITDQNVGFFKQEGAPGWGGFYIPNWAWTTSSGTAASDLQYPALGFHVSCATCHTLDVANVQNTLTGVKAFPNPSNESLNIAYNLANSANVTVVLANTLGQVVATQTINNATTGTATFNTAALPAGVYAYSVIANGQRLAGTVVVAH